MRYSPVHTDDLLYRLLTADGEVNTAVQGRIYPAGQRPLNSTTVDIAINTIALDTNMPQTGTSNVNIHVPDIKTKVGRQHQYVVDRNTLRRLTTLVVRAIEHARPTGVQLRVSNQTTIAEESIHQHYMNIRVEWNIQCSLEDAEAANN